MSSAPNPFMAGDENPEWTKEDFARARPIREVDPSMVEATASLRKGNCFVSTIQPDLADESFRKVDEQDYY